MAVNLLQDRRRMIMSLQPRLKTASGQTIEIADGFHAPMASCMVTFGPAQAGSGDPSPANVRTISGRTGLSVYVSPTSSGGTEYPVSWQTEAGTVYAGTVDLATGLLTVTHAAVTIDETTAFDFRNSGRYVIITNADMMAGSHYTDSNVLCDRAVKVNSSSGAPDNVLSLLIGANDNKIYFYHFNTALSITSSAAYTAWIAQNPVTYTYPLANPLTYQLTPQRIMTIDGTNNIRSDAGSIMAAYYAV